MIKNIISDNELKVTDSDRVFCNGETVLVCVNDCYMLFDKRNGKPLWDKWAPVESSGLWRQICVDNKYNFVHNDGWILTDEWFSIVEWQNDDEVIVVRDDGKRNLFDVSADENRYMLPEWHDVITMGIDDNGNRFIKVADYNEKVFKL